MRLKDLWSWAVVEAELSEKSAPERLHVGSSFPPDTSPPRWVARGRPPQVGALPFTRAFETYLEDPRPATPIRLALRSMFSRSGAQSEGYTVCWAIIEGGYVFEDDVAALLGCTRGRLNVVAFHAMTLLYEKTQDLIARERRALGLDQLSDDRTVREDSDPHQDKRQRSHSGPSDGHPTPRAVATKELRRRRAPAA